MVIQINENARLLESKQKIVPTFDLPSKVAIYTLTRPMLTGFKIDVRLKLLTHNKNKLYMGYKKAVVKINILL